MEEKVDIVALGEFLIDFTEAGHSQDGRKLFEQNPGGALDYETCIYYDSWCTLDCDGSCIIFLSAK